MHTPPNGIMQQPVSRPCLNYYHILPLLQPTPSPNYKPPHSPPGQVCPRHPECCGQGSNRVPADLQPGALAAPGGRAASRPVVAPAQCQGRPAPAGSPLLTRGTCRVWGKGGRDSGVSMVEQPGTYRGGMGSNVSRRASTCRISSADTWNLHECGGRAAGVGWGGGGWPQWLNSS
jgi:hypothetical protein